MTDIEQVKALVGKDDISDSLVSFYLDSSAEFIKSYCNIDAVPTGLKNTYLEIAALKLAANTNGLVANIGAGVKAISSVSDGNQSISYGSSTVKQFVGNDDFVASYSYILNRYRKLSVDRPDCRPFGARDIYSRRRRC